MQALYLFFTLGYATETCSSSPYPLVYGGSDYDTEIKCMSGLSSAYDTIVVGGTSKSNSFLGVSASYDEPFLMFIDPSTGLLSSMKLTIQSSMYTLTSVDYCEGNAFQSTKLGVALLEEPNLIMSFDGTTQT